jgi:hypothetical protein
VLLIEPGGEDNPLTENRMFYMAKDSELSPEFLIDEDSLKYYPLHRECKEPTLAAISDYCDQECENANYHDFVGSHRELGLLISEATDDATAARIMCKIAERGSLMGLASN